MIQFLYTDWLLASLKNSVNHPLPPPAFHQSATIFSHYLTSPKLNFAHLTRRHSDDVASGWYLQKTWPPNAAA